MKQIDNLYDNAVKVMNESLECYGNGELKKASALRSAANKLFEAYDKVTNGEDYKRSTIYGDNRNFGVIYRIFEENAHTLAKTNDGVKIIGTIVNYIKENKILKNQFNVYNTILNNQINESEGYADKVFASMPTMNRISVKENNDKLITLMESLGIDETVYIPQDDIELYESIEYPLLNKQTLSNINEYDECRKHLNEHAETLNENRKVDLEENYLENLETLEEKYDKELNDDEKKFLDEVMNTHDRERMFTANKEKVVKKLNETIALSDKNEKEQWKGILEKVEKKNYNEKSSISDIAEFIEIYNTI